MVGSMFRRIRNFVIHLAHFVFPCHHYTNEVVLCLPANLLVNSMCQNMFVMDYFYNSLWMHLMGYLGRQKLGRKKQKKKLQNKSSRFVLGLAIDYMCVCVCVCRFLRVSAFLTILFLLSLSLSPEALAKGDPFFVFLFSPWGRIFIDMNIIPYFNFYEKCFFSSPLWRGLSTVAFGEGGWREATGCRHSPPRGGE